MLHLDFKVGWGSAETRRIAFGKYLRETRLLTKLSAKDFCEFAELYPSKYCAYERSNRLPTRKTLKKITEGLAICGVDEDTISRLEKCHDVAVDSSSNFTIGRIRREF